MKSFWSLLALLLSIIGISKCTKTCKKIILYSHGATGLEKANNDNPLCPGNNLNCCSKIDFLKLFKLYHVHVKPLVHGDHNKNKAALLGLSGTVKKLLAIDFHDLIKKFEKKFANQSEFFKKKLKGLKTTLSKFTKEGLTKVEGELKEASKEYYKRMLHLRKGFICGLCDHNFHLFTDVDSNEITYSANFCSNLVAENIGFLKMKYVDYLNYIFTLVDVLFMITGEELMTKEDMKFFRAAVTDVEKCSAGGEPGNCNGLCAQYNVNKMSFIWDGEKLPLDHFKEKMGVLLPKLEDKENAPALLKYDEAHWVAEEKKEEEAKKAAEEAKKAEGKKEEKKKKKEEDKPMPKPDPLSGSALEQVKKDSLHFTFAARSIKEHVALHGVPEHEHVPGIDNEAEEFRLYQLAPKPIKIEQFKIKIASLGLDPLQSSKGNNLETSPEEAIELIFAKGSEILPIPEKLADSTKELLTKITIPVIMDFINGQNISFDRLVEQSPKPPMTRPKASLLTVSFPEKS
jgi:hypothetical protein